VSTAAAVFGSLAGRWAIERSIEPGIGHFAGTATFSPLRTDVLHYREDGELVLATGYTGTAYREYVYVLSGESIEIRFAVAGEPGAVMHTLHLAQSDDQPAEAADVHLCRSDRYTGRYRFEGDDRFTVWMDVAGPEKDYQTTTIFRRAPITAGRRAAPAENDPARPAASDPGDGHDGQMGSHRDG
jgi:hypothetical protein